ncbi:protein FAR1-RELATED SEQUENCE 5-like isoform X2 [Macadamia integrifolia]|uniref:protein FAR1-RELATED SEQUENCE 5-like isoform X2 n=1 Tax=Macadamia integrifolia TaxID=60698 RepID=UPI001C4E9A5B|nr:protein FAR1-RELATED SEQUENCE 5-like isoform X2 [Macadamia integrifolia]XP_042510935.1 protein FAR1-RELATED SEQUENCE 5-like isoform X2 [Macadamia integrifolia]
MEDPMNVDVEIMPRVGMLFTSEQEAYDFYNTYGRRMGFIVRREWAHRSMKDKKTITSRIFVCNKQGSRKKDKRDIYTVKPRAETRTECPARMGIAIMDDGKYYCRDFVEEHNHLFHLPSTSHMLRPQRSRHAGGKQDLEYTRLDQKNYLPVKRQQKLSFGEAGSLLLYFENQSRVNPSFIYSLQLDKDEHITNIFWADPKMRIDYAQFGDVVTFVTTFCTNKEYRPFGIFTGFNHHKGVIIFGAVLLYDETVDSFKWLFEAFLKANGQKKPITIFTDQDAAMEKAIAEVLPDTCHRLCTWHLMQNGIKHLGNMMKDGSDFLADLKKCVFHYDDELQFENAWGKLRSDYPVEDSSWLDCIYGLKDKWAKCYMKKTLTIGMWNTKLSESINGDLKDFLRSSLDVVQFFKHFERVVANKRAKELEAEFDARNKLPRNLFSKSPIMKQAGEVYTPLIFEKFQKQYEWVSACYIKHKSESNVVHEYVVSIVDKEGEFKVFCNPSEQMIHCSCRKFETFGILCRHALKILDYLDIKHIPDAYILRRWTRVARSIFVQDSKGKEVAEDVHMDCSQRVSHRLLYNSRRRHPVA